MIARVSHIEAFRRWRLDEAKTVDDLVRWISSDDPTERMAAGTAFHKAMETAEAGDHETLSALGHTFHLSGGTVEVPAIRETRGYYEFPGITVTGQADCIHGKIVTDHKTTARFDADNYLAGYQWRLYLLIFGADLFRWNVFEIKEVSPQEYQVAAPQMLTASRYPGMEDDCQRLALDYLRFAKQHLPRPEPEPWEFLHA